MNRMMIGMRPGLIAAAACALLSACGQGVPSTNADGAASSLRAAPFAAACSTSAQQPKWIFKGACKNATLAPHGVTVALAKYRGITVTLKLPATTLTASVPLTIADATGKSDITPYKGKAFPLYHGSGKSVIYLAAVNHATKAVPIKASGSLVLSIAASSFPGTSCKLVFLKGTKWAGSPIEGSPKNGTLTLALPGEDLTALAPGTDYLVVPCS